jgi:hypothetical protein
MAKADRGRRSHPALDRRPKVQAVAAWVEVEVASRSAAGHQLGANGQDRLSPIPNCINRPRKTSLPPGRQASDGPSTCFLSQTSGPGH